MCNWWRQSVLYEIYMPSFKDGNGDGIGDFAGITSKLDYLKELGVNGIWLTPFYPSPKVDNGYDIADYYDIDQDYGKMEDFEQFIKQAHHRNMNVIIDLVLNHTSSKHPWFLESKSTKNNPKRNWYIWKDEPNNWESFFGGPAWEYDETTSQYYYHAFAREQVDLNWANPEVKQAMFDVMKYWLDKGVDGFRLDVINFLKINNTFQDNPFDNEKNEQNHLYDKDQEGILSVIKEIAKFVHHYPNKFLVGEVGSEDIAILKQYCGANKLDVVFNFNIGSIPAFDLNKLFHQLVETERAYDQTQIPTLFFSSHDMPRFISRFGNKEERAKLFAVFMLTAKGVPFIYYGDEIGMRDWIAEDISKMKDVQGVMGYQLALESKKTPVEALDIANEKSRDKSRTPMQWDCSWNAGFSEGSPWISIPKEAEYINVKLQQSNPESLLSLYKKLLEIRKNHPSLQNGDYEFLEKEDDMIYFMKTSSAERVLVFLNFGDHPKKVQLENYFENPYKLLFSTKRQSLEYVKEITIMPQEGIMLKEEKKNA